MRNLDDWKVDVFGVFKSEGIYYNLSDVKVKVR